MYKIRRIEQVHNDRIKVDREDHAGNTELQQPMNICHEEGAVE